jgi:hypothetical protein
VWLVAGKPTDSPGRSTRYYRKNKESYKKKLKYDTKYGKTPAKRKYRSELTIARKKRGILGKGGPDLSHTRDGKLVPEDPNKNRARNGSGDNARLK